MSDLTAVWVGLRADGVELSRVRATCVEESRANGIATYRVVGVVLFPDIPADVDRAHLTFHRGPDEAPFTAGEVPYINVRAGESAQCHEPRFAVMLEVPWHERRRVRP